MESCDTWDNALLHTWAEPGDGNAPFPLRMEMKRLAPGETNSWFFEVSGTEGGVRFTTKRPKTLEVFSKGNEQVWSRVDLGFATPFKTVTGGIFEVGFPDLIQQMWASFLVEREGGRDVRFPCASVGEAVASQRIFAAALRSQSQQTVEDV
jgi:predicted dehydrogenase